MPALVFDTCCGFIELRTGCLIIAYLELVLEVVTAIIYIIALTFVQKYAPNIKIPYTTGGPPTGFSYTTPHVPYRPRDYGVKDSVTVVTAVSSIMLLVLAVALAFSVTLLVGVYKNKRRNVMAYIIFRIIFLVVGIILSFVAFASTHGTGMLISNLFSYALNIYFLLVVRSYYYRMDAEGRINSINSA